MFYNICTYIRLIGCKKGTYGLDCKQNCDCEKHKKCDRRTGKCKKCKKKQCEEDDEGDDDDKSTVSTKGSHLFH